MEGREEGYTLPGQQGEMQPVYVAMDQVEVVDAFGHLSEQDRLGDRRVRPGATQAQAAGPCWHELRAGGRVAARKQRDLVSEFDQLVDQPGDDAFCPSVKMRRYAFSKGCNLRDAHRDSTPTVMTSRPWEHAPQYFKSNGLGLFRNSGRS
jgi:hypothetical protein